MSDTTTPAAIARALALMRDHPGIASISSPNTTTTGTEVTVDLHVAMRPKAVREGVSTTGVKRTETTTWHFPPTFPERAPRITLRQDFDRSLAHVQPGHTDEPPEPCILYGSLDELLQDRGINGIIDQLADWLDKAAAGTLIDPKQGWEPVRRDILTDTVIGDLSMLDSLIASTAGKAFFRIHYLRSHDTHRTTDLYAFIVKQVPAAQVNAQHINGQFGEQAIKEGFARGISLAVLLWPAENHCTDTYLPETVFTLGELRERAELYGCTAPLEQVIRRFQIMLKSYNGPPMPVLFIVCARRPYPLIGSTPPSPIEHCMYRVDVHPGQTTFAAGNSTPVWPAAHRDALTETLARRLSGTSEPQRAWTLVGAGSLGSKLAIHLTRAGLAPRTVIDKATLHAHNVVRHALLPESVHALFQFQQEKVERLKEVIDVFGPTATAMVRDVRSVLDDEVGSAAAFAESSIVVNTTASLTVREVLSRPHAALANARIVEAALFDEARIGIVTREGTQRNPTTGYLIGEVYQRMRDHPQRRAFFATTTTDTAIGQGCSSPTFVAADAAISRYAAPMADALTRLITDTVPPSGEIAIGHAEGMSTLWETHTVDPCTVLTPDHEDGWSVHLGAKAREKITDEVALWPTVETGGVLIGRCSEIAQSFYITDVISAPSDSVRETTQFVLGTKGLRRRRDLLVEHTKGALYVLGTWHSHLAPSGPSPTDGETAQAIAVSQTRPALLLIHTPIGYRALFATNL